MTGSEPAARIANVRIQPIATPVEYLACQALQRRAWGITDDGYVVPVATMVAVQKAGGLVLGAFNADNRLVGFSFAFLGRVAGTLVLYSQLSAIEPELQGCGLGRALKIAQRRQAASMGLPAIVWAFDPLQARNAAFNLGALGVRCRTYEVDLYGPRTDALNAGLATDRLLAEWPTEGPLTPGRRERWQDGVEIVGGTPIAGAPRLHVPIPANLASLRAASLDAARARQHVVRAALTAAFAANYVAVGFASGDALREPCYLLELDSHR